jgi:hypothetical protein
MVQQVTHLLGINKKMVKDSETGKQVSVEIPNLLDRTTSATLKVGDGEIVLIPVLSRPKVPKARDRVLVLLVQPMIYIEEEEREKKKGS